MAWYVATELWEQPDAPYRGGTNYLTAGYESVAVPVKVAFGFQREHDDWGEAGWTAKDLR